MSNFAERLVARSAGTPPGPGISVLASRPVSRFEPVAGIEVEATVSPDLALPQSDGPIAQRETERTLPQTATARSRPGETSIPILQSRPRDADAKPQVLTAPLMPVPNAMEVTPDHAISNGCRVGHTHQRKTEAPKQITESADPSEDAASLQRVAADARSLAFGG